MASHKPAMEATNGAVAVAGVGSVPAEAESAVTAGTSRYSEASRTEIPAGSDRKAPAVSDPAWNSRGASVPRARYARPGVSTLIAAAAFELMMSTDSISDWTRNAMLVVTLARMSAVSAPWGRCVAMIRWMPRERPMVAILMSSLSASGASSTSMRNSSMTITRWGSGEARPAGVARYDVRSGA